MGAELSITGLRKVFPGRPRDVVALDGVALHVPAGAVAAVLGPSGCGKTTLLRMIAGFDVPDAGSIALGDRTVVADGVFVRPERRGVGVVPQEGALFPHLTVAANIGFGIPRPQRPDRVAELLALVGLEGYARRRPDELSGGEQQRVALARALAARPGLVLLDEPFSALDANLRASLREDVRATLRRANTTAVLVTHDQEEALSTADLVAVMRAGRVVQTADPETLYREPADLEVARFVGDSVQLSADVSGDVATCALGQVHVRRDLSRVRDGAAVLVVRPEQITLADDGVRAQVTGVTYYGHDALVRLRLDGTEVLARLRGEAAPPSGATVGVRVVGPVLAYRAGS